MEKKRKTQQYASICTSIQDLGECKWVKTCHTFIQSLSLVVSALGAVCASVRQRLISASICCPRNISGETETCFFLFFTVLQNMEEGGKVAGALGERTVVMEIVNHLRWYGDAVQAVLSLHLWTAEGGSPGPFLQSLLLDLQL